MGDVSLQRQAALSGRLMLEGDLVKYILHGNIYQPIYYQCTVATIQLSPGYKSTDVSGHRIVYVRFLSDLFSSPKLYPNCAMSSS